MKVTKVENNQVNIFTDHNIRILRVFNQLTQDV
jgi:hypothetical protein